LNPVARHVLFRGLSIAALTNLPVQDFAAALGEVSNCWGASATIARDLVAELGSRTAFLCDVGLGYLQLNRARRHCRAAKLSGSDWRRNWGPICRA